MPLYNPLLALRKKNDWNTTSKIINALEGFEIDYFYNEERLGKDLIELKVCPVIEDADDNMFLRCCDYSGNKEKWKEVIQEQIKNQLRDIGVEEGFIKSEKRYFEVTDEKYLIKEKYESQKRPLIHKITSKEL